MARGFDWRMAALLLSGCGEETTQDTGSWDEIDACMLRPLVVEPGTGGDEYIPLGEGDPVTMVHGPQGGWHIEVGGRVQQADAAIGVAVAPRITVPELGDLEIVGDQQPTYTSLVPVGGPCDGTFYGVQGFVDTDQPDLSGLDFVCALDGVPLQVEVTVSDIGGERSTAITFAVTAALDPNDVADCR